MRDIGVGLIGCGNISGIYLTNLARAPAVTVRACADARPEAAHLRAAEFGIEALPIDSLLARDDIDIVVNLTVPAAHAAVSLAALSAGKHVFSEKPLAVDPESGREIVADAARRGLLIGCAPDTFLGAGARLARRLIDEGAIGRVVAGTAFVLSHGMEHWHPDPEFFFKPGGGPVLDMGPYYLTTLVSLLGPIARVRAMTGSGFGERTITAEGPRRGHRVKVETPTTAMALLEFVCGAQVMLGASWDVWKHGHHPIELYGAEGSLRPPDPNFYGGVVEVTEMAGEWIRHDTGSMPLGAANWPSEAPQAANYRGLGVVEMAAALRAKRAHRASGELALHVLEVMDGILRAGETGGSVAMRHAPPRPDVLGEGEAAELMAA